MAMINMFKYLKIIKEFIGKKAFFWLGIGFFSSVLLGFVDLAIAFFIQLFMVSLGFINSDYTILGISISKYEPSKIALFLFLIGVIRFLGQLLSNHSSSFALDFLNCRLRTIIIHDLLFKSSKNINCATDVNFRISELFPKSSAFISSSILFLSSFLQGLSVLIFMFISSWKESFIALIGILIIGVLIIKINKSVRKVALAVPNEQFILNSGIEKISRNILFINVMRTQLREKKVLIESAINYSSFTIRANFLNNIAATISPFLGILLLILIIIMSQMIWKTPGLILLSFLYLLIRFIQNLSSLAGLFGQLNVYYTQFRSAIKYFFSFPSIERNEALQYSEKLKFYGSKKRYNIFEKQIINVQNQNILEKTNPPEIKFLDVTYSYPISSNKVLNNLNFDVKSGSQIGIIGPSGSGKSTILFLLLNILLPQKGEIKIDHLSVDKFYKDPTKRIGYVGPEPFLIKGTLRDNICYGISKSVSDEDIMLAFEKASLKELITLKGLDYEISEDHSGLSAGQKQRLCLARAILNDPHLLVLDEATANLDETTESEIADTIDNLKGFCTVIIVSHRPGILRNVDNIIKLE